MDLRRLQIFRFNTRRYGFWPKSRGSDNPGTLILNKQHPSLEHTGHRPWPLPERKWILRQRWLNLAFMHWEIDYIDLRKRIPSELEIDTHDGKAWIAIVPFDMSGVTLRNFPTFPPLSNFPEINVRSYVIHDGRPGVWFFSLDAPSRFAVWAAQKFFHLPYRHGAVATRRKANKIFYSSEVGKNQFEAEYQPLGDANSETDSFERWSTERYCLYCQSSRGNLYRTEVHHPKWSLQKAEIAIQGNSLLDDFKIGERHPSILYSESIDVVAYFPERIA